MCGIVGLFLKDKSLEPELGMMLSDMLVTMTDRGPDSAGIAIYGNDEKSSGKITIQSDNPDENFKNLDKEISAITGTPVSLKIKSTHAVLDVESSLIPAVRKALKEVRPSVRIMSAGDTIEIYKEVGLPKDVAARFDVSKMSGTHGIGHTRMQQNLPLRQWGRTPFLLEMTNV